MSLPGLCTRGAKSPIQGDGSQPRGGLVRNRPWQVKDITLGQSLIVVPLLHKSLRSLLQIRLERPH